MNTTRIFLTATLLALTACSQVPPGNPAARLAPLAFGTSASDGALALARHGSGVYVVGYVADNFDGGAVNQIDAFIRKYDSSGAVLWAQQFGSTGNDLAEGVATDAGGNAYVAGSGSGLAGAAGSGQHFLRKYSPGGSVLWTRHFSGGNWAYEFGGVAVAGNSVYVVGNFREDFQDDGPPPPSNATAFIRKFSSSGTLLWSRTFGTPVDDLASDVAVDGSGNAYVAGTTYGDLARPHGGGGDMFIRKYAPDGSVVWSRQLSRGMDVGTAVAVSGTSVYLAGSFDLTVGSLEYDVRVVKLSSSGSRRWDRTFGAADYDYVSDIHATDRGVVFAGITRSGFAGPRPYPNGYMDGFAYKLDPSGNRVWSRLQATAGNDQTNAVLDTPFGVVAAGQTAGTLGATYHGGWDSFLRRLNSATGVTVWTDQ